MSTFLLEELFARKQFGVKLGLETMQVLACEMGEPQKDLRFIHIAGTNGKGSTAAMLAAILQKAGYKVGLFTSPHLVSFGERIQVDGVKLSDEKLVAFYEKIRSAIVRVESDPHLHVPTFFEITTLLGLLVFQEAKVDWVVWETGMGGRLDATNIVMPHLSIITSISWDHQQWLGSTLEQIAGEKAGIIKSQVPVVSANQVEEVRKVIIATAEEKNSRYAFVDEAKIILKEESLLGQRFVYRGSSYFLKLLGDHQRQNAASVLEAINELREQGVTVSQEAVKLGLSTVIWPARFQILREKPLTILDGAHNEAGVEALVRQYSSLFGENKINLIFGMLSDKNIEAVVNRLLPIVKKVGLVMPKSSRALQPKVVASYFAVHYGQTQIFSDFQDAWDVFQSEPVLITGSLYLAGEVLSCLKT
ncbi:MAG: folylpolyglutamate synthase/dihydrofolate synthase family protein [Verrucomicrobiia bacterium]